MEPGIIIYADGACAGNPGPGGWAVIIQDGATRRELSGGFRKTTNNRMELLSVIAALDAVAGRPEPVTIHSDSRYVVDMINGGHAERWRRNGWMRDRRQPALNRDLWERILTRLQGRPVQFAWVRGHDGNTDNERADALAVEARLVENLPPDEGFEAPPLFVGDSLFG